jgi:ERCC4-type nuclease
MVRIILDTREGQLISLIKSRDFDKYSDHISIEVQQLDIGDIHVCFEDGVYIIERKTVADLLASVKDGRYREQKARLLASGHKISYVIEGDDITASRQTRYHDVLTGAYIHSMFRDGINVVFTRNTNETCTFILTLCAKIVDNPHYFGGNKEYIQDNYIDCIKAKSKKIDNITPENCFILQLSQIPSISTVLAKNIQKQYATMKDFIKALDDAEDKLELLCQIDKIGKEKAKKILEYMAYSSHDTA